MMSTESGVPRAGARVLNFSTASLPVNGRVELWEGHNSRALIPLDIRTLDDAPMHATQAPLEGAMDSGGLGAGVIRCVRPWNGWLVVWGYDIYGEEPELDEAEAKRIVRKLAAETGLEIKAVVIGWRAHGMVDDPYFALKAVLGTLLSSRRAPQLTDKDRRLLQTVPTGV